MTLTRRNFIVSASVAAAAAATARAAFADMPMLAKKDTYKIGFA